MRKGIDMNDDKNLRIELLRKSILFAERENDINPVTMANEMMDFVNAGHCSKDDNTESYEIEIGQPPKHDKTETMVEEEQDQPATCLPFPVPKGVTKKQAEVLDMLYFLQTCPDGADTSVDGISQAMDKERHTVYQMLMKLHENKHIVRRISDGKYLYAVKIPDGYADE